MQFPILVSPSSRPDIILEFTAPTTARIIHACKNQMCNCGYTSPIGFKSKHWTNISSFHPSIAKAYDYIRESWGYPSPETLASSPYVRYHYPELLI